MDANRIGALAARSDVGLWDLLQMVRGTLQLNTGCVYNSVGDLCTAIAQHPSSRLLD